MASIDVCVKAEPKCSVIDGRQICGRDCDNMCINKVLYINRKRNQCVMLSELYVSIFERAQNFARTILVVHFQQEHSRRTFK